MPGQMLNTKEACEYIGVSYWTLTHKLLHEIPHIQRTPRGKIRFKKSTLDNYLEKQEEKSMEKTIENITPVSKTDDIEELRKKYQSRKKTFDINKILDV